MKNSFIRSPRFHHAFICMLVLGFFSRTTDAQTLQQVVDGQSYGYESGWALYNAGDMDSDGSNDVVVGCPDSIFGAGSVEVRSLVTGAVIHQLTGEGPGQQFGAAVCGGQDVTGDGVPDFIVGAPGFDVGFTFDNRGKAYLYSGADGSLVQSVTGSASFDAMGSSVCFVDDLDSDGYADIAVGAYGNNGQQGQVLIVSSATGATIFPAIAGQTPGSRFGYALASVGDQNNDGIGDFIVGAPFESVNGGAGRCYLYSGSTGAILQFTDGTQGGEHFGTSLCGTGDLDGDGVDDYVVGAPDYDTPTANAGCARAISSTAGVLWQLDGPDIHMKAGLSVSSVGDVNQDQVDDILVGMPYLPP